MAAEDGDDFYEGLQKRWKLPSFEELDKAFEISSIDNERFFLREVVRKIEERIKSYSKILDVVLEPDTKIAPMRESNAFSEKQKQETYQLYKKLRFFYRQAHEVLLMDDDEACAGFIKELSADYPAIREEVLAVVRQMKDTWQKELVEKSDLAYFG